VEREPASRARQAPDQAEQPPSQRLRRHDPFAEPDPGRPTGEFVGDPLDRQPGPVGGELACGLDELLRAEMRSQRGRQEESRISDQAIVVEGRIEAVEAMR